MSHAGCNGYQRAIVVVQARRSVTADEPGCAATPTTREQVVFWLGLFVSVLSLVLLFGYCYGLLLALRQQLAGSFRGRLTGNTFAEAP